MSEMLYIGIDGGGTKTIVSAYDIDLGLVRETVCGPLNYNFIGMNEALENLTSGIAALGIDRSHISAVGIGDPSIDDASESDTSLEFASAAQKLFGAPMYIRSDAYITLYGLTGGRMPGVLVISGTGAMAVGEDKDGRVSVAGGWGRLTGDEGSGYYIGLSALRLALRCADGIGDAERLCAAALEHFGVSKPRELIEVFYGSTEPDIAGFAKCVSECAGQGDTIALEVLHDAAACLADQASVLLQKTHASILGVYGSILTKDRYVRGEFERLINDRFAAVRVTEPQISAQCAAAGYAKMMKAKND